MTEKVNLDMAKLEKRMTKLERTFLSLNELVFYTEASLRALEKAVAAAIKTTHAEMDILLHAMPRERGVVPRHPTTKHLIKALMEDEYGVKLNFRKQTTRQPSRPRSSQGGDVLQ
jgi:hypothetical protein